jgi:two-component system NtrC family sensor kinase
MFDRHYYKSLTRSMILTVFLVSLAPLALISVITSYQFHTAYKDRVHAHLRELVMKHKRNIDGFLAEKLTVIRVLADLIPEDRFRNEIALQGILKSLRDRHHEAFVDMGLVNAAGLQVAYAGPFRLERADYAEAAWFREAMRSELYISDVFLGLRGAPHFIVAVKVRARGEEWILRATVDFVAFNELVESVSVGETGLAYIVNAQGEFQTRPRREPAVGGPELKAILARRGQSGPAAGFSPESAGGRGQASQSVVDLDMVRDQAGRECLLLNAPLKDGDWTLIYQQEVADAYQSLFHARNLSLFVILAGGVGILLMAFVVSNRMVSRIVDADRERDMMNEQVIEAGKLVSVGELAAGIAHEINNPLAIIMEEAGWVQDLLDDEYLKKSESYGEMARALTQIRDQGDRCRGITHKLLSFARKIDPTVKPVQINDIVRDMAALSEQRARFANVHIIADLEPDLPVVPASPSELQQVLVNLINNAIDAMEQKGGELKLRTRSEPGFVTVSIADSGMGIPKANLARIFDPFYTTKPVGKGTGLGLSICFGIVKKMGGTISVESAPDQGATFHVRLPRAEGKA